MRVCSTSLVLILILMIGCNNSKTKKEIVFTSRLDKTAIPKLFFPGEVTQRDQVHFGSSFSEDGKYITYTTTERGKPGTVVTQTFGDGAFLPPIPIEFDTIYSYSDASISLDGNTITLASSRPHTVDQTERQNSTLWQFQRAPNGWYNPQILDLDMGMAGGFGYPTMTQNKTIYFHFSTDETEPDLYRAEWRNGQYNKPEKLPAHINTDKFEGDVFVDRLERFIIFAGFERSDNYGLSDLYISFKTEDGWSGVVNLGEDINSHGYDGSPSVTSDDKFLVFTSSRHPENPGEQEFFNLFYVNFDLEKYEKLAMGK